MAPAIGKYLNRYGFRSDEGRIDAPTWRQGTLILAMLLTASTLGWLLLAPFTEHDLSRSPFLVWQTAAAFAYLVFYAFAVLLIAICYHNLSIKRWRDRGWRFPGALAALLPLAALLSGALNWLQPRITETMSYWYVMAADTILAAAVIWNVTELGLMPRPE